METPTLPVVLLVSTKRLFWESNEAVTPALELLMRSRTFWMLSELVL